MLLLLSVLISRATPFPADPVVLAGASRVPTRDVAGHAPSSWVTDVIREGRPAVLRGALGAWSAPTTWTRPYLEKAIPSLKVHVPAVDATARLHSIVQPLGQLRNVTWDRPWTEHVVDAATFFRGSQGDGGGDGFMFFAPLKNLSSSLRRDVRPEKLRQPFTRHLETNLWMGTPGTTTPAHYDLGINMYAQIRGRKRFVLLPPSVVEAMPLFPRLHPSTRELQVPFGDSIDAATTRAHVFPDAPIRFLADDAALASSCSAGDDTAGASEACAASGKKEKEMIPNNEEEEKGADGGEYIMEAVLAPGDVLFLPPYWAHHVTALPGRRKSRGTDANGQHEEPQQQQQPDEDDVSVSISVCSESEQMRLRNEMLEFVFRLPDSMRLRPKAVTLVAYLAQFYASPGDARDAAAALLRTRYRDEHRRWWGKPGVGGGRGLEVHIENARKRWRKRAKAEGWQPWEQEVAAMSKSGRTKLEGYARRLLSRLGNGKGKYGGWGTAAAWRIEFGSYVEDLVFAAFSSAPDVVPFLEFWACGTEPVAACFGGGF